MSPNVPNGQRPHAATQTAGSSNGTFAAALGTFVRPPIQGAIGGPARPDLRGPTPLSPSWFEPIMPIHTRHDLFFTACLALAKRHLSAVALFVIPFQAPCPSDSAGCSTYRPPDLCFQKRIRFSVCLYSPIYPSIHPSYGTF